MLLNMMANSMSNHQTPVKVHLKLGNWEVEINCPQDQVRQVVEDVVVGLGKNLELQTTERIGIGGESQPKKLGRDEHVICRDLIEDLWREEWFSEERNLSEVHVELSRRGYHYNKTSISHSLADLVRENVLTRMGSMRNYRYIQKRPAVN